MNPTRTAQAVLLLTAVGLLAPFLGLGWALAFAIGAQAAIVGASLLGNLLTSPRETSTLISDGLLGQAADRTGTSGANTPRSWWDRLPHPPYAEQSGGASER